VEHLDHHSLENVRCSGQQVDELVLLIPRKYLNESEPIKLIVTSHVTMQKLPGILL